MITASATLLVFTAAYQSEQLQSPTEKLEPIYKESENVAVDPTTDPGFAPFGAANTVIDVKNSTYVYDRNEKAFDY
ncbi:hypothetical protein NLX67_21870 [Domibacillus sp. A3M-37]|uniref:hypothetical protein n=1 Tax=Domibacillus sp. A3M-37 TaxID=2962037 RepID=UPI0020B6B511|nr:hypothetical protein [Domibacillus sp. A3M-37]MCP3764964.1 hypothetical protein [Domibacillus sp. A3M-37]